MWWLFFCPGSREPGHFCIRAERGAAADRHRTARRLRCRRRIARASLACRPRSRA
ncbi:hypothetical protein BURPS668_A2421 [Burkholderia pseudomallei 668]|nr:hypothetical protein BURPS668_A2421 [Burkholderia pseudomallei 668]